MELLIFSPVISPRLEYIFRLILTDILGIKVKFTADAGELSAYQGPAIMYGHQTFSSTIPYWEANTLLFEDNIYPVNIDESAGKIFFPVDNANSLHQHDPFAAAFYLVSRYEEYLPFKADQYGRFEAQSSMMFRKNVLDEPLVNQYALEILQKLLYFYPELEYSLKTFPPVLTIDIDQSYSYRNKGFLWNGWIFLKHLLPLRTSSLREQLKVLFGDLRDPYDSFEYLRERIRESYPSLFFFIHAGDRGPHDKVIPVNYNGIPVLIRSLGEYAQVGIHPSFRSNDQPELLGREINRLQKILGKKITASRQHYLKLSFPGTYHNLIREGIQDDYTMGYASRPGFRAGICTPFRWFDLASNKVTKLVVHPITWMEGNFIDYLKMNPESAWEVMVSLEEKVKQVHGQLLTVWHNHTITDYGEWKGWKKIFEKMLDRMQRENGE